MDAESGIRLGTSARGKAEKQTVYECLDDQRELTTLRFTMVEGAPCTGSYMHLNDGPSNSIPTQ